VIKVFSHHTLGDQKISITKPVVVENFWSSSLQQPKVIKICFQSPIAMGVT
jgi:hypothetical protein